MKPKLLLRIAAVIIFIHAVLHTIGHAGWKKAPQPERQIVIVQMTGHKVPFMGSSRSLGDYFEGYGYACTLAMLLIAFILWAASTSDAGITKKITGAVAVCLLFWSMDEFIYFFPFAAVLTLIAALLSLIAFFRFRPGTMG